MNNEKFKRFCEALEGRVPEMIDTGIKKRDEKEQAKQQQKFDKIAKQQDDASLSESSLEKIMSNSENIPMTDKKPDKASNLKSSDSIPLQTEPDAASYQEEHDDD